MLFTSFWRQKGDPGGTQSLLCNPEIVCGCTQGWLCTGGHNVSLPARSEKQIISLLWQRASFLFLFLLLVAELSVLVCRAQQSPHCWLCQTVVPRSVRALSHPASKRGVFSTSLFSFYKNCFWKGSCKSGSGRKNTVLISQVIWGKILFGVH